jgi:hypothetical protein
MKGDRNILTPNYIIGESIIGEADNAKATGVHADNACEAKELDAEIEELRSKYREMLRAEKESLYNNTANSDSDRARQRAGQTRVHGQTMEVETFDVAFWMILLVATAGFGLLLMPLYIWAKKYRMEHPYEPVDEEQSQFYDDGKSFAYKSMIINTPEYILTHLSTEI